MLSELRVESPARTSWRVRECAARRRELSATGAPARLQMSFGGGAFEFRLGEVGPPTGARGKTFNFQVSLALAQLWTSHAPVLRWARKVRCPHCNGMGATADHVHTCPYCNGAGLEAAAHQHGEEGPHGEEEGAPARGRAWGVLAQELASTCAACGGLGMVTDRGHVCRQCKVGGSRCPSRVMPASHRRRPCRGCAWWTRGPRRSCRSQLARPAPFVLSFRALVTHTSWASLVQPW